MRGSTYTRGKSRIIRRAIRVVRSVSHSLGRTTIDVSTMDGRSSVVNDVIRAVHNVTSRAGLLTLGTTVRTTHTNRRKHKFTIITSRIHDLTTQADRTALRVIRIIHGGRSLSLDTIADVRSDLDQANLKMRLTGRTKRIVLRVRRNSQRIISTVDRFGSALRLG